LFYRINVEERGGAGDRGEPRRILVLHAYQSGVEVETVAFDLSAVGARNLFHEVRWLEWKNES